MDKEKKNWLKYEEFWFLWSLIVLVIALSIIIPKMMNDCKGLRLTQETNNKLGQIIELLKK